MSSAGDDEPITPQQGKQALKVQSSPRQPPFHRGSVQRGLVAARVSQFQSRSPSPASSSPPSRSPRKPLQTPQRPKSDAPAVLHGDERPRSRGPHLPHSPVSPYVSNPGSPYVSHPSSPPHLAQRQHRIRKATISSSDGEHNKPRRHDAVRERRARAYRSDETSDEGQGSPVRKDWRDAIRANAEARKHTMAVKNLAATPESASARARSIEPSGRRLAPSPLPDTTPPCSRWQSHDEKFNQRQLAPSPLPDATPPRGRQQHHNGKSNQRQLAPSPLPDVTPPSSRRQQHHHSKAVPSIDSKSRESSRTPAALRHRFSKQLLASSPSVCVANGDGAMKDSPILPAVSPCPRAKASPTASILTTEAVTPAPPYATVPAGKSRWSWGWGSGRRAPSTPRSAMVSAKELHEHLTVAAASVADRSETASLLPTVQETLAMPIAESGGGSNQVTPRKALRVRVSQARLRESGATSGTGSPRSSADPAGSHGEIDVIVEVEDKGGRVVRVELPRSSIVL